jgi:hypothetical protein
VHLAPGTDPAAPHNYALLETLRHCFHLRPVFLSLFMYLCVYLIYVCMYVCMYVCVYVYMYGCI